MNQFDGKNGNGYQPLPPPPAPPPARTVTYGRPLRIKRRTLKRIGLLFALPALAYLCGALFAQGFVNGLG